MSLAISFQVLISVVSKAHEYLEPAIRSSNEATTATHPDVYKGGRAHSMLLAALIMVLSFL